MYNVLSDRRATGQNDKFFLSQYCVIDILPQKKKEKKIANYVDTDQTAPF